MPFNEESFNKYEQDLGANEHYYQNQIDSNDKKKKIRKKKSKNNEQDEPAVQIQSASNLSNLGGYTTSSTASSNRELLSRQQKHNYSYVILFFGILFELLSFIAIVITFIFPFWISFQIDIPDNFTTLNITNKKNSILMSLSSNKLASNKIKFDMGIWEVKMNTNNVDLIDLRTNVKTTNQNSMLWLNSDSSNGGFQSFLVNFLSFIELSSANIFTVQILEIIYLIFTFLTFSASSLTLCLCSKNRTSLCWYLICYFLCLISFLTGLAVIIIIIVWQTTSLPSLEGTQAFIMSKSFNWCFWTSVGINSSLFFASFLILCYIIVSSILSYNNRKNSYEQKGTKKHSAKNNKSVSILKIQNGKNNNDISINDYSNNVPKLPRLQTNGLQASPAFLSKSNSLVAQNTATTFNNLQSLANSQSANPSYTFYTGFGNYHKQNICLNQIADEVSIDTSYPHSNSHLPGYPMIVQNPRQTMMNQNNNDHAYSNVFDQINQDFKFQSYH